MCVWKGGGDRQREREREREKAGRGWRVKTWQRKELPFRAPLTPQPPAPTPGETYCLQNKQRNEKDNGGLRSGRSHEMRHKHTEPHPRTCWHTLSLISPATPDPPHLLLLPPPPQPLTSSAPSCGSPPPYLWSGPRRAARGSCSSSGACRTERSSRSHAQTACPRSSHIWKRGGGDNV